MSKSYTPPPKKPVNKKLATSVALHIMRKNRKKRQAAQAQQS